MTAPTPSTASAQASSRADQGHASTMQSLYERLGGARNIAAIVDDVVALHLANPIIKARFLTIDPDKLPALKKVTCEFFGAGSGGPEVYTGRDLITAHKGMNINEQELIAAIDDVVTALDKNGIGQSEKNEVVAILYSLKDQVLRV